ncbi:hypothetical protein [Caldibacillus debilis]|jgi:hypothetical protein|uniref:hypothetical protein n=1 Tax=Caldibacillus debilis TaxID=301148 RepID=UPI0011C3AF39|nr:hypothetical protein [Caldibacillus debilis]
MEYRNNIKFSLCKKISSCQINDIRNKIPYPGKKPAESEQRKKGKESLSLGVTRDFHQSQSFAGNNKARSGFPSIIKTDWGWAGDERVPDDPSVLIKKEGRA